MTVIPTASIEPPDSSEEAEVETTLHQILEDIELIAKGEFHKVDSSLHFGDMTYLAQTESEIFQNMFIRITNAFKNFANKVVSDLESGVYDPESDPGVLDLLKECFDDLELNRLPTIFADQSQLLEETLTVISEPVSGIIKNEILFCRNAVRAIRRLILEDNLFDLTDEEGEKVDRENPFAVITEARLADDPEVDEQLEAISEIAERIRTLVHTEGVSTSRAMDDIGISWMELAFFESEAAEAAFCAVFDFVDRHQIPNHLEFGTIKMFLQPPEQTDLVRAWTYKDFALNSPAPLEEMMRYCPHWMIGEA